MSKQKKAKRDRRPNIPVALSASGGGLEMAAPLEPRAGRREAVQFNYTHIKKDLTRIGVLAVSFIVILVVLSFFLNK
jgi:hypothetical protein